MATRTSYAGTVVDGDVYTAANHAKMPGGWIGYVEATSNQGTIVSETDLTGLSVTVTAGSSRRLKLSSSVTVLAPSSGTSVIVKIKEGSTVIATATHDFSSLGLTNTLNLFATVAPSSGSHTYKVTLQPVGGTFSTTAASGSPNVLLVEDVGPAS